MLYHTDIVYSIEGLKNLYSDLGVKLHGAVMKLIPTEYAEQLHRNEHQPFSLFCIENRVENTVMLRLSALTDEAELICRALSSQEYVTIYGLNKPLERVAFQHSEPIPGEAVWGAAVPKGYKVDFISPAVFRRSGKSHCSPEISRYLRSAAEKLALFEGIAFDIEKLLEYAASIPIDRYSLNGQRYNVSGSVYSGMTGWMELIFPDNTTENAALLNTVLRYAEYSGLGAKTAVGMGGISLTPIELNSGID